MQTSQNTLNAFLKMVVKAHSKTKLGASTSAALNTTSINIHQVSMDAEDFQPGEDEVVTLPTGTKEEAAGDTAGTTIKQDESQKAIAHLPPSVFQSSNFDFSPRVEVLRVSSMKSLASQNSIKVAAAESSEVDQNPQPKTLKIEKIAETYATTNQHVEY